MVNYFYYRDRFGNYTRPVYYQYFFWLCLFFVTFISSNEIYNLLNLSILTSLILFSGLALIFLLIFGLIWLGVRLVQCRGIINYWNLSSVEEEIRNNLLRIKVANRLRSMDYVEIPAIWATYDGKVVNLRIRKLAGYETANLDSLVELVNSSFDNAKFKNFVVTTKLISDDRRWFKLVASDLGTNRTFIPNNINDLIQKPYFLTLQEDLTINLADEAHIICWGKTNSGKSTTILTAVAQLLSYSADLFFIDGKEEFSSFSVFYPKEKIVSTSSDVLRLLNWVCEEEIPRRQKIVADAVKQNNILGLRGYDIGLRPLVIVADEIASVISGLDSKQKKVFNSSIAQIVQKGRSISVFLVVGTQSPAVTVLSQDIRSQFAVKILLGSANKDIQRMAFDESTATEQVEKFTGFYTCDGITVNPEKFFVPNLFQNHLENLDTFSRLYKYGKENFSYDT